MKRAARHTRKHIALAEQRMIVRHKLISFPDLARFDLESVCRSHGLSIAEGQAMFAEEAMRRRARA